MKFKVWKETSLKRKKNRSLIYIYIYNKNNFNYILKDNNIFVCNVVVFRKHKRNHCINKYG